jgi:EmrB/QacA subfamily drug resistance transporter
VTAEPTQTSVYFSHRQIVLVMIGVMSGMLLAALDQSIVGTALPRITSELGGLDKLSWVVTAYLLTATAVALCGFAQSIEQLIAFRALQGIGGGGLFSIALSIIGDVIPPRERGRYQGYFGAVFGVSSVAGPLLGGFFTDGPGWRWIFYINLPIGIAALFVTSAVLKMPVVKREHNIDYLGATAIVGAVSSLLLYLQWRGRDYGWAEPAALTLLSAAVVLTAAFILIERRAVEPIIPMRLFGNPTFRIGNIFGFCAGVAMFGAIVFLPLYLQAVQGYSATGSGLAMLPAILGILSSSVVSGLLMSKTGHYKMFPVIGSGLIVVALLLMSTLSADTPYWRVAVFMLVFGVGLGMTMQTLVTAIQNDVPREDMGAATSSTTFFRQMGGAIGTAVFGAVLGSRLALYLAEGLGGAGLPTAGSIDVNDVQAIQALDGPARDIVLGAFADALGDAFLIGAPFLALAFVVALFLKEKPLKTGAEPAVVPTSTVEATPATVHR